MNSSPVHKIRFEAAPTNFSDAMPDIRSMLDWKSLDDAKALASETNRPIFALVVAHWSTGAHLVSQALASAEIQELLVDTFIPVHIDPTTEPSLTAIISAAARYQNGSGAMPIVAILSPQGDPYLAYTYTSPEHSGAEAPTIHSVLLAVDEQWDEDPAVFEAEWKSLNQELPSSGPTMNRDSKLGGFQESPRQLRPYDLVEISDEALEDPWLQHTLDTLWLRGIRDQLEPSFHPESRDSTWAVPFFEKIVPQNAAMALAYARIAQRTQSREARGRAQDLARFVLNACLQNTDVMSGDSFYYTWLSTEAYEAVSRQNLQAVSLLFNIQPSERRQVLNQVRTVSEVTDYSFETEDQLLSRVLSGTAELLMHRRTRPTPRPISFENMAWRAESYRWLLLAMECLGSSEVSLLLSSFTTWVTGRSGISANFDASNNSHFQEQVSVLACLLQVRTHTSDAALNAVLERTMENVKSGIELRNQSDSVENLWLEVSHYLPSVRSSLEAIRALLPAESKLPTLG